MNREWLSYLCDPNDRSELRFEEITKQEGDEVISATLVSATGRRYAVRQGVPILLGSGMQSQKSVESFAYEWDEFGFLYAKEGWVQDIATPLAGGLDYFRDKIVVDAGAGSGAQTRWMAEAGAKLVISLELSNGVFNRHKQTVAEYSDRVLAVQCDIAHPPVRVTPDVIYCVNVLQHTANPEKTFAALANLMGAKTEFIFNVYTKSSETKFRVVRAVRRAIRFLPFPVWKWLAFGITGVAYPLSKIGPLNRPLRMFVPISHSFKETWLDVYDAFGGHHFQENMTRADQLKMIKRAGLAPRRQGTFGYLLAKAGAVAQQREVVS